MFDVYFDSFQILSTTEGLIGSILTGISCDHNHYITFCTATGYHSVEKPSDGLFCLFLSNT